PAAELQAQQPARLREGPPGGQGEAMSASAAGKAGKSGAPGGATLDAQLRRAEACLARFSAEPLGHFIAGKAVAGSGETFDNASPVDGRSLDKVSNGTPAEVAAACEAARDAFGTWKKLEGT